MNKLTVTLKQHTPLIHFQHDQEGAMLRASEVKPKLDRFILEKAFHNNFDECKRYLVGYSEKMEKQLREKFAKGFRALDYKLRFEIEEQPLIFNNNEVQKDREGNIQTSIRKDGRCIKKLKPYPLFFANLNTDIDDPSEYKRFSFLKKPFRMKIITVYSDLVDVFKEPNILAEFFQFNNFGTRQSKGFGSFYIDIDDELFGDIELEYRYSIDIRNENKKWIDLFESIELFYKSLRSGINICWGDKFYINPAIFKYAKNRELDWDKKLIKQALFDGKVVTDGNDYLFKDLLGLSTEESWKSYNTSITKKNEDIERFPSPIIIKPIDEGDYFNIFIDSNPFIKKSFNKYLNQKIKISSKNRGALELKTYPDFDIDNFLKFALLENDLSSLTNNLNHPKYITLLNMYNEIKREEHE